MSRPVVSVTSGASDKLVATLASVKSRLGISGSSSDAQITAQIKGVGELFRSELGRAPWRQTYSEQRPGEGGIYLPLTAWPIESVSSITVGLTNPDTVDATSYSVAEPERSTVYREDGWKHTAVSSAITYATSGDRDLVYTIAYVGGWVFPGSISDWTASTAYSVGDFVRPVADGSITVLFECTTAGTSDATEPTWDTDAGDTTVDNTATWTAREATELPWDLQEAAILQAVDWYRGGMDIPSGIKSERHGPHMIEYDGAAGASPMTAAVRAVLRRYK